MLRHAGWWAPDQAMQDELREAVLRAERAMLYALGFEQGVQHPYSIAMDAITESAGFGLIHYTRPRNKHYDLPQFIFNFTNVRFARC
jgi:hypothetical protein